MLAKLEIEIEGKEAGNEIMTQQMGIGWSLGAGFGLVLGLLTGEIALWMVTCVIIGSVLGFSGAFFRDDLDSCCD